MQFQQYRRKQIAELRPYQPGESMEGVSISAPDKEVGSPKPGDMIARNPKNHADKWLVAGQYFADNFESFIPRPLVIAGLIEDAAKKQPADARADFAEILASEDDRATILRALRGSAE